MVIIERQVTIHSNRIYEYEYKDLFPLLSCDCFDFNKAIYHMYNVLYDIEYNGKVLKDKSNHLYLKHKYDINDYYANSILKLAKGVLDSSKERNKELKELYKAKITSIEKKLKDKEYKLAKLDTCLNDLHQIQANLKLDSSLQKTNLKLRTWRGSNISYDYKNNKYQIKTRDGYVGIYYFEYNYLLKIIRRLKSNISKLKYALNNTKTNLENIKNPKRICFGGVKFIKDNLTKKNFKQLLYEKKYKQVSISGRCDAKYGNFVYKYTPFNKTLTFTTFNGKECIIENLNFPYLGDELINALNNKQPICFGYKLKKDSNGRRYVIFTASFKLINKYINKDISTGIIAIDTNFGHFDLANIDSNGNLIDTKTIKYEITDNKIQNELNLRKAIKEIGTYVKSQNKILAKENLNLQKLKNKCKYQNKNYNKMLHYFPFAKIDEFINNEASQKEFEVVKVEPSYTSVIGKYKYANDKKLNTHISASFVIGRRALGYKEHIPDRYKALLPKNLLNKRLNKQWIELYRILK